MSNKHIDPIFNTSTQPLTAHVEVDPRHTGFDALSGDCPTAPKAPGQLAVSLAPLDYMICRAK